MTDILIAARFIHYAAAILLFGASLYALYGATEHGTQTSPPGQRLRRLMQAGAILALLSALVWFADSIANMTGDWADNFDPDTLSDVLFGGDFGTLWLVRMPLIVVLLVLSFIPASTASVFGRMIFALLAAIVLGSLALTGHAELPKGGGGILHRITDVVHLLAAGAWLGGLAGLGVAIRAARKAPSEAAAARVRSVLPRFSRLGYWAVGLVVITGAINGIILVDNVGFLVTTLYGRLVLAKIVLALAMVGFALANRFRLTPLILTEPGPTPPVLKTLGRNVAAEQLLGIIILVIVAFLGTMIPAMFSDSAAP